MKKWLVTVGFIAIIILAGIFPGRSAAEIKLGILPRLGPVEMFDMFSPLAEYLTRETGEKVSIVIPRDFEAFKTAVKAGQLDLGFANSIVYIQLRKDELLEPLAVATEPKAGKKFRGVLITRKEGSIRKLLDLKGKKLVFVDKDSAAGYIFQMLLLHKAGIDVGKDFTLLPFAKRHDNVVHAVFNKAADAGGIREDDLEKMRDRVDMSQLRIVGHTDYYPNWPMFATPTLSNDTRARIKSALLKLKSNEALFPNILRPAGLAGFSGVSDSDYDQLRKAAGLAGAW